MTKKNPIPPALPNRENSNIPDDSLKGTRETEADITERRQYSEGLRVTLEDNQKNNYADKK
ncbi:MAG: hypothetical protein Q4A62_06225 [Eikenella sp.]|nr:hypothetical protein [Eikenella sp.]